MKCYNCERLPEYICNCMNPHQLICSEDLKIHTRDKTKNHSLKFLENVEEKHMLLVARENLINISTQILSETKE